jgi:hypothetical protein
LGGGSRTEDPVTWLERVDKIRRAQDWNDRKAINRATGSLVGSAETRWDLYGEDVNTWLEFCRVFREKYVTEEYIGQARRLVNAYRQRDDQSIDDVVAELTALFKRAEITNGDEIDALTQAVQAPYRRAIAVRDRRRL